jgi:hypothetical protein
VRQAVAKPFYADVGVQNAARAAARKSGSAKRATWHNAQHSFATHGQKPTNGAKGAKFPGLGSLVERPRNYRD